VAPVSFGSQVSSDFLYRDQLDAVAGGEDDAFADAGLVQQRAGGVGETSGGDGEALANLDGRGVVIDAEEDQVSRAVGGRVAGGGHWGGEPVDGGELVCRPDGEHDQEDEAGEIGCAAATQAGLAADVDHSDVGEPHGKGEQYLGVAEVGGAHRHLREQASR